jgi:hypothetical protein
LPALVKPVMKMSAALLVFAVAEGPAPDDGTVGGRKGGDDLGPADKLNETLQ